jgi:uncharacterized protein (UPF0248 family)
MRVAERAETPRSPTQEQVSLEDTEPWWPLTAVQAWIVSREPSTVVALCGPLSAIGKAAILLRSKGPSGNIKDARRELLNALAAERVIAYGDRRDGSGLKAVPAVEWSRLEYFYETGSDRAGPYHDVVIARAEALRQWSAATASQDADTPEAIGQGAVPSRAHSEARLRTWWFDEWLEHHKREGTIPSRDQDWEAAKVAVSPHVPRDAVRRLRRDHAPEAWKTKGRRQAEVKKTGDK